MAETRLVAHAESCNGANVLVAAASPEGHHKNGATLLRIICPTGGEAAIALIQAKAEDILQG